MYFEESLKKLEEILNQLESGNLSLENSIVLYQEGIGIAEQCKLQLNEAKLKIIDRNSGGNDETTK